MSERYADQRAAMMDAIEAELDTFQWAHPDRGDANRGEIHVDRETRRLHLTVWCRDNEAADDDLHPLDVTQDIVLGESPREQIRDLIHGYLCHEADEQMWFNGDRPFYPHHQHEQGDKQ